MTEDEVGTGLSNIQTLCQKTSTLLQIFHDTCREEEKSQKKSDKYMDHLVAFIDHVMAFREAENLLKSEDRLNIIFLLPTLIEINQEKEKNHLTLFSAIFAVLSRHQDIALVAHQELSEDVITTIMSQDSFWIFFYSIYPENASTCIKNLFPQTQTLPSNIAILFKALTALKYCFWSPHPITIKKFINHHVIPALLALPQGDQRQFVYDAEQEQEREQYMIGFYQLLCLLLSVYGDNSYPLLSAALLNKLSSLELRVFNTFLLRQNDILSLAVSWPFVKKMQTKDQIKSILDSIRMLHYQDYSSCYTQKEKIMIKNLYLDAISELDDSDWQKSIGFIFHTGFLLNSPDIVKMAVAKASHLFKTDTGKYLSKKVGSNHLMPSCLAKICFEKSFYDYFQETMSVTKDCNPLYPLIQTHLEKSNFLSHISQFSSRSLQHIFTHRPIVFAKYQNYLSSNLWNDEHLLKREELLPEYVITALFSNINTHSARYVVREMLIRQSNKQQNQHAIFNIHCALIADLCLPERMLVESPTDNENERQFKECYHAGVTLIVDKHINQMMIPPLKIVADWLYDRNFDEIDPLSYAMIFCEKQPSLSNKYHLMAQEKIFTAYFRVRPVTFTAPIASSQAPLPSCKQP